MLFLEGSLRRRSSHSFLLLVLTISLSALPVFPALPHFQQAPDRIQKHLGSGVVVFQEVWTEPPLVIHGLRISRKARVQLRVALAGDTIEEANSSRGREPLSRTAWRHRALAAVNGDFFPWTGDPMGLCILRGELVSEPFPGRPAIGWNADQQVVLGTPLLEAEVERADGQKYPLMGVNRPAKPEELVLHTNYYGALAKATTEGVAVILEGVERPIRAGRVVKAFVREVREKTSSVPIPFNGGVLFGTGPAADFLQGVKPGDQLRIRLDLKEEPSTQWREVVEAISGGPWLIKDGQVVAPDTYEAAGFKKSFWNERHPRTAVGVTPKGELLWIAVDGRQPHSQGATLPELAQIMARLGASQAINLDGGGSTTLVVRDLVVNTPSEGSERAVANGVLILEEDPRSELEPQPYEISPPEAVVKVGDQLRFRVLSNGKPVSTWEVIWGNTPLGFVDQWGRFRALRAGTGIISAWIKGVHLHARLQVTNPASPTPTNDAQK